MIRIATEEEEKMFDEADKKQDFDDVSDVILYSNRKEGVYYYNCMKGRGSYDKEEIMGDRNIFLKREANSVLGYYITYSKKYDVIFLYEFSFDKGFLKEGETRGWRRMYYYNNIFVLKRDGDMIYSSLKNGRRYFGYSHFDSYIDICGDDIGFDSTISIYSSRILRDFFGNGVFHYNGTFGANNFYKSYFLQNFVSGVVPINSSKQQEKIDKFLSYELGSIPDKAKENTLELFFKDSGHYPIFSDRYKAICEQGIKADYREYKQLILQRQIDFCIIQKVSEGIAVMRFFLFYVDAEKLNLKEREFLTSFDKLAYYEYGRIYVTKDDMLCMKHVFNNWYYTRKGISPSNFSAVISYWNPEDVKGTKLEFFDSFRIRINEKIKKKTLGDAHSVIKELYSFLESPIYESFCKSGYDNIIEIVQRTYHSSVTGLLKTYFGEINLKEKSFFKAIGCPAYMLKVINEYDINEPHHFKCIAVFKRIFASCPQYFQRMNENTFKRLLNCYIACISNNYWYYDFEKLFVQLVSLHGPEHICDYMNYISSGFFIDSRMKYIYIDYINMCYTLKDDLPHTQWKFKEVKQLEQAHDDILLVYNTMRTEVEYRNYKEKFDKRKKTWDKYLFSEKEFSIVSPEKIVDIANEGLALNHCVKSYIDSVIDGKTNILFVRKTDDLKTPFYTLEIKDNKIRQCHGFANCNVDKVIGLSDFLERFCKEKKVTFSSGERVLACGR